MPRVSFWGEGAGYARDCTEYEVETSTLTRVIFAPTRLSFRPEEEGIYKKERHTRRYVSVTCFHPVVIWAVSSEVIPYAEDDGKKKAEHNDADRQLADDSILESFPNHRRQQLRTSRHVLVRLSNLSQTAGNG